MLCEVLMIVTIYNGSFSLMSECKPNLTVCQEETQAMFDNPLRSASTITQCVEIGALVDQGRKK